MNIEIDRQIIRATEREVKGLDSVTNSMSNILHWPERSLLQWLNVIESV